MGSVGQRASKLLADKVGDFKKKFAIWPQPLSNQPAWVQVCPGSNLSQSLTDSNFVALWPTDLIFTASKDLNPLQKYFRYQETSYNFRLGFALSNRLHFNSTHLLRVPFSSSIAVYIFPEILNKVLDQNPDGFTITGTHGWKESPGSFKNVLPELVYLF